VIAYPGHCGTKSAVNRMTRVAAMEASKLVSPAAKSKLEEARRLSETLDPHLHEGGYRNPMRD
jgi:hypothetical protein